MDHYHFKQLCSTNDWAKKELKTFARDKITLVTAGMQTAGRGQYGRTWFSPKGVNIYGTFCFFIEPEEQNPLSLTHVLAISTIRVLEKYGVTGRVKWPNDILVNKKKIAGILCETTSLESLYSVVIGIGLNINMTKKMLEKLDQSATSLFMETGETHNISEILESLKSYFISDLAYFLKISDRPC